MATKLEATDQSTQVPADQLIFPRMEYIAPDGPQGSKLKIGLNSAEDERRLKLISARLAKNGNYSVGALRPLLTKAGLKEVDT